MNDPFYCGCCGKASKVLQHLSDNCYEDCSVCNIPMKTIAFVWGWVSKCPHKQQVYNTTVEVKQKYWGKFADLVSNQFNHGGNKYQIPGFKDREGTDIISAVFGGEDQNDWVLGTMMKYLFRFKNFKREKDLLKVATYCFILWLKNGHHLKEVSDEDTKQ